ncbi:unnamed protein product [Mytilus edulis]|uniref:Retrotransposon gag domain-containing protein n=1 Tax=Mytilus edulis TaxID=6550 RepID=A0A8S3RWI9_MYTED|nr:unnamed protein product [Mytilus edulis]
MFKATGKPTKPGKTPLNYSKEAEHHKLDTAFHQLNILPEEEQFVLKHRFENRIPEREDTTIPFVQDPWTLPPQYSDQPTGPVPDHNPFIPSSVSTPIRPLQPTRLVRPKIPQAFLTHSTGTSTPGPVQQPYPGTPLLVNKLSLPALQTPSHFSSNTAPAAIAIVTAATTVPSSSASSIPISTTSAPPPATTTSTASAAISAGRTPIPPMNIFNMSSSLKIEKFKGDNSQNPETWLNTFKQYCSFYDLTKQKSAESFPFHLEDHARIWYDTVSATKKSNFDELISVFKERFKDKQHLLDLTILQTHQGRTESVLDYLSRLLKLSTNRNISDDILLAVAMNGLRSDFKTVVMTKEPKNIEELRHAAVLAEKAINSSIGSVTSINQTVLDEIHSLKEEIKSINVINSTPQMGHPQNQFQQPPNPVYVQQPYFNQRTLNQQTYISNRFRQT